MSVRNTTTKIVIYKDNMGKEGSKKKYSSDPV